MAGIADILISLVQYYSDHNKTNKTIAGQTFQFFMEEKNHFAEASVSQNIHNHTKIFLL